MTPLFIYVILYSIVIRTPVVCGDNINGSPNVTFNCFETTGQSHFVEIDDEKRAKQFVANLAPYNHTDDLEKSVSNNTKFILGLTTQIYTKIEGKWILINEHKLGDI